jgi:hypothetical protein
LALSRQLQQQAQLSVQPVPELRERPLQFRELLSFSPALVATRE